MKSLIITFTIFVTTTALANGSRDDNMGRSGFSIIPRAECSELYRKHVGSVSVSGCRASCTENYRVLIEGAGSCHSGWFHGIVLGALLHNRLVLAVPVESGLILPGGNGGKDQ